MGLDSSATEVVEDSSLPAWNGVPKRKQNIASGIWLAFGVVVFLFFNTEMPSSDGFGGYVPLILAVLVTACGILSTERVFLRSTTDAEERD